MTFRRPAPDARSFLAAPGRLALVIGILTFLAGIVMADGARMGERDAWARVGEACGG